MLTKKEIIIILVIAVVAGVGACLLIGNKSDTQNTPNIQYAGDQSTTTSENDSDSQDDSDDTSIVGELFGTDESSGSTSDNTVSDSGVSDSGVVTSGSSEKIDSKYVETKWKGKDSYNRTHQLTLFEDGRYVTLIKEKDDTITIEGTWTGKRNKLQFTQIEGAQETTVKAKVKDNSFEAWGVKFKMVKSDA